MSREEPRDYSQHHLQKRAQTEICANSVHITFPGTQLWKPKTDEGEVERRDEKKIWSATFNMTLQAWTEYNWSAVDPTI